MEAEIQQLVEMGATVSQARAALKRYKDVMQAAERIFDGQFDDVGDEDADMYETATARNPPHTTRIATPEDDHDNMMPEDEDDGEFIDYDSDYGVKPDSDRIMTDADPYAGIFFSKDRCEEVIEVEEDPEHTVIPGFNEPVRLMTQGQWMKGCPEGSEQAFLFAVYSQLSGGDCPCPNKCGYTVSRAKKDFFALHSEFLIYIEQLQQIIVQRCPLCSSVFCFACGEAIATERLRRPTAAQDDDPLFHCPNLQGVILGVGLHTLEQLYASQTKALAEPSQKPRQKKKRKTGTASQATSANTGDDEDDVYYANVGKKVKEGIGYAGDAKEDNSGQLEAQAIQQAKDKKIGELLTQLRIYLPSLHRPGGCQTSDYLVHPTALAHLRRRFNTVCSSLLRNDSLADMSDRSVLYFELLEWLETISNHEALASMMAMPCMVVVSVKAVAAKKPAKRTSTVRERVIVYEGSSGPRELLEVIVIQAKAALKGLEGMKPQELEPEEMTEEQKRMTNDSKGKAKESMLMIPEEHSKLLSFCRRIVTTANGIDRSLRETKGAAFVERLHKSLPKIHPRETADTHINPGTTEASASKAYVEWATRVRFEYCDLIVPPKEPKRDDPAPHYKFYFDSDARVLADADIPKRSLAIAKELAILTTNLPVSWDSSIFLRVDESRVDIIKALIIGPAGTPYQNGCFLFDIFLGQNYNASPPSVRYMTTNGGKYRFNPNLYADGKVCLSLLGTWSGPGWISGKSTLLQVLISIQSMILCEEPFLNEPGYSLSAGSSRSHAYSANARRMVVKTAMLENLKNPPEPFQDIIRTHFKLKSPFISTQLDEWLVQDDNQATSGDGAHYGAALAEGSSNGFREDIEELKELLRQLADGE